MITSRYTGISGEWPHTALSGVGDPTERHAFLRLYALGSFGVVRLASGYG